MRLKREQERLQQRHSQDLPPPTRLASNIQSRLQPEAVSSQGWFPDILASSSLSRSQLEAEAGFPSKSSSSGCQQSGAQAGRKPLSTDRSLESTELLREFRAYMQLSGSAATEMQAPGEASEVMPQGRALATRRAQANENLTSQGELAGVAEYAQEQRFPSYGSSGHYVGACKPCLFWYHQMCLKGERCDYCHILHNQDDVKKVRPSKATRTLLQERGSRTERSFIP